MPYGGTSKDQDARIERCVSKKVREGVDKVRAIRICKASILKADEEGRSK